MTQEPRNTFPTMYPYFGYRDAAAALKWLAEAFGFQQTQAFPAPDGTIVHAEMTFGNGAIMLGTINDDQSGQSGQKIAPSTHGIYIHVDDVDAHYERAKAAGAHIVYPPENTDFGTRRYRVLDPEGYEWSFGTYRPATANG